MFKFQLHANEKLTLFGRQSPSVLFKAIIFSTIYIYMPWFFVFKYELKQNFILFSFSVLFLVLLFLLRKYLLWLLNCYVLTDSRLIILKYSGLFNKKIHEIPLDRIQNINVESRGFFKSILDLGSVTVQIQGLHEPMLIENVSKPIQLKDKLWEAHKFFLTKNITGA